MITVLYILSAIGAFLILLLSAVALIVLIWGDRLFLKAVDNFFHYLKGGV